MDARRSVSNAVLDALAVLLPVDCAGCGAPDRGICAVCRDALAPAGEPGRVLLRPPVSAAGLSLAPPPALPLWFAVGYAGVPRDVLHALKERGRIDAARLLGSLLAGPLGDAVGELSPGIPPGARLEILVVPSSRRALRTRGYNPVESLLRWAGPQPGRATGIRYRRTPRDQAALGADERWANLAGSLEAVGERLNGRHLLLVDDVVTTGATLLECRRAAQAGGAAVYGATALAHTAKVK